MLRLVIFILTTYQFGVNFIRQKYSHICGSWFINYDFSAALAMQHQIAVNNKMEKMWNPLWPVLSYYPRICLEELGKTDS